MFMDMFWRVHNMIGRNLEIDAGYWSSCPKSWRGMSEFNGREPQAGMSCRDVFATGRLLNVAR